MSNSKSLIGFDLQKSDKTLVRVGINEYKGRKSLCIKEMWLDENDEWQHSKKVINLSLNTALTFIESIGKIDEAKLREALK